MSKQMPDGFYPVYIKDGKMYPVALTKKQVQVFEMTMDLVARAESDNKINVIDKPIAEVYNMVDELKIKSREGMN